MFKLFIYPSFIQFRKNKGSCITNILSFSIAIGILLIVGLYLKYEYNFDNSQSKKDNIYRLEIGNWAPLPPGIKEIIKNENCIKNFTRLSFLDKWEPYILNTENDKSFYSFNHFVWADTSIFNILTFKFNNGSSLKSLASNEIFLSTSTANKIFGNTNAINQIIYYRNGIPFTIKGVFEDIRHSHLQFDAIGSMEHLEQRYGKEWMTMLDDDWAYPYYLLLNSNQKPDEVEKRIESIIIERGVWDKAEIKLTPISELYLYDKVEIGKGYHKSGDIKLIYTIISISLFILLISIVNYINLSTATIKQRIPEIFIKRTIGAKRNQIFIQFIIETVTILIISLFFGFLIAETLCPLFNNLFVTNLQISDYYLIPVILSLILVSIFLGILSGIYPAFILTRISPTSIKNEASYSNIRKPVLRKILMIFQFCLSSFLIIVSLFINEQITYLKSSNVGFKKENIITLKLNPEINKSKEVFRSKVLVLPEITKLSYSCRVPGEHQWVWSITINGEKKVVNVNAIDPDFIDLYGLNILEGRNFSWERTGDKNNLFLFNEAAKKQFNLDKVTEVQVTEAANGPGSIIGLIEDFNFSSAKENVSPTLYYWLDWPHNRISIQFNNSNFQKSIIKVEKIWDELVTYYPFEYEILEDVYDNQYQEEEILIQYFIYLALVAIFIALMGLYAITRFITNSKTKIMGIHKVLGASSSDIFRMLFKEITIGLLISFIISIPISVLFLRKWMHNFANKTSFDWWIFALSGLILFVIATSTIYYHIFKLSRENPVDSLRYE